MKRRKEKARRGVEKEGKMGGRKMDEREEKQ